MSRVVRATLLLLLFGLMPLTCAAQEKKAPAEPNPAKQEKKNRPEKKNSPEKKNKANQLPPEVVFEFVRKHHPEIEGLLNKLKQVKPDSYRSALKTLSRSVKRVKALEKDPNKQKYQDALRHWKARSRINLKAVQLGMENNPQRKKELEDLINQDYLARKQQLERESDRLKKRMATLEKQMQGLDAARDQELKRQLKVANDLTKRIQADKNKKQATGKKANDEKQKDAGK